MSQSRTFKAAVLGSGQFLVILTELLCFVVLSRIFTKTDYASYRQTLLAYTFLAPLLALGFPRALYYFLPQDRENGRSILTGNLLLLFLMGCLFAVAMWCGGNKFLAKRFSNPALIRLLLIFSPYALLVLPARSISACLVSYDRVKILTIYNVISRVVVFACILGLVLIWRSPDAAISGKVIGAVVVFLPAMFLMYRTTAGNDWRPTKANIREQMKYSVPLGMAVIVGTMNLNLDKVVVSSMCSSENFAIYVNGAMEIPLISVVTMSITSIILPDLVSFYKSKDYMRLIGLWRKSIVKAGAILIPTMVFLFFMAPQVMRVLFSAGYERSAGPFRVLLLLLVMRTMSTDVIFLATNHNKLILIRSIISLSMNLFLNILFVRVFGYIGAAISTVSIAYIWSTPFTLLFIKRILNIKWRDVYPFADMGKIILASLLGSTTFVISLFIKGMPDLVLLMIYSTLYAIVTMFFLRQFGVLDIKSLFSSIKSGFAK